MPAEDADWVWPVAGGYSSRSSHRPLLSGASEQVDQFVGGQGVGGILAAKEEIGQAASGVVTRKVGDLFRGRVGGNRQ